MTPDAATPFLDTAFWFTAGAIGLLLVLSAFFSGSETALTAASRGKLRSRADRGDKGAARALAITEDNERLIGSVLLGNNLVNILATSLATALLTRLFGPVPNPPPRWSRRRSGWWCWCSRPWSRRCAHSPGGCSSCSG